MDSSMCDNWAIPERKTKQAGAEEGEVEDMFWKPSGISHIFTLSLEIPDKSKFHLWKFHKFVLGPSGNSKAKNQDLCWKFHIIFSSPLEIPLRVFN